MTAPELKPQMVQRVLAGMLAKDRSTVPSMGKWQGAQLRWRSFHSFPHLPVMSKTPEGKLCLTRKIVRPAAVSSVVG